MPLQKQTLAIPFAVTLDTKTDPFQLSFSSMQSIVNAVYTNDKKFQKRNGYTALPALPIGVNATLLTTFNGNLTAVGNSLQAFASESDEWINKGFYQPIELSTQPYTRSSLQQSRVDTAVTSTGLACAAYLDGDGNYKYQINDSTTSQVLVDPVTLPSTATEARVFSLGSYFVITFLATVGGITHLRYIAVPVNNITSPFAARDISTTVGSLTSGYDGFVSGSVLYLAWGTGSSIKATIIDAALNQHQTVVIDNAHDAKLLSVTVDETQMTQTVWVSYNPPTSNIIYSTALSSSLGTTLAPTIVGNDALIGTGAKSITSSAQNNLNTVFASLATAYTFNSVVYYKIYSGTITSTGTVVSMTRLIDTLGLASKSFIVNSNIYLLTVHGSLYQPSYFLIDSFANVVMKLAYSNGSTWLTDQVLSNVWLNGTFASTGYLFRDLLQAVNKDQNAAAINGIYTQTGLNLAMFDLTSSNIVTAEIGSNLHLSGGFVWMYDGNQTVEHNFHLWPEDFLATGATSGGSMADDTYFYQITYEWTDAQGNIHRSAPSVPAEVIITGGSGAGSTTFDIPTLWLTYKTQVRIVIYRWSSSQQNYYQVTSIASPLLNDKTVDYVTYTDTLSDASIIGNSLIYTTGGVVENIAYPACNVLALFKSRLMVLDAEDTNLVWFSKQVIEAVPVEPSDLLTLYVAPTIGAQGSTGPVRTMVALDDKFIFNKAAANYYITGNGPDNTGANNDFSDPIFITATVGSSNQHSITFIPQGIMLKSEKGIWLLGRDLNTSYIGAPVEAFNDNAVTSVVNPPGQNQVRFCLDNDQVLMYDYYYGRWGTFNNISSVSSTLYNGLHVYLRADGAVFEETPGLYLDNGAPVLMSFTTAWLNLAGLQGYQRFHQLYILGQFYTPNKMEVQFAYDYNPSSSQSILITASNYSNPYASANNFADSGPFAGPSPLEQWRLFPERQRCQAVQITVNELYDQEFGTVPGFGLTFSGLNIVYGLKKGFHPQAAASSAG